MITLEASIIDPIPETSLEERRDRLHARLDAGYRKIDKAIEAGEDVSRWEQGWLKLLREYEYVCDQIAMREHEQATSSNAA
jgi:hypothetical protein